MKQEGTFAIRHQPKRNSFWALLMGLGLTSHQIVAAQLDLNLQTVALTGTPAPGAGAGANYASFGTPFLGPSGHVVVRATFSGAGVTTANDRAICLFSPGTGATLLAREGNPAAGASFAYGTLDATVSVDARGSVTFSGTLAGALAPEDTAAWGGDGGDVSLLWREGGTVPGTAGALGTVLPPERVFVSPTASLRAFSGTVGISGTRGIWSHGPGGLRKVALEGDAAPGTTAAFNAVGQLVSLGSDGGVAFAGGLNDFRVGVWIEKPALVPALISGQLVPTGSGQATFSNIDRLAANAAKQVAVVGRMTGAGVTPADDQGVWTDRSGPITLVARSGMAPPLFPQGTAAITNIGTVMINASGQVAFAARLTGSSFNQPTDMGVWVEDPQLGLVTVMHSGMAAPGTEPGVVFQTSFAADPGGFNAAGEMVICGILTGPGVTGANDRGLWLYRNRRLTLLLREADQIQVAPGDWRTISVVSPVFPSAIDDGSRSQWSDRQELLIATSFTDGSIGLLLLNLAPAPRIEYTRLQNGFEIRWPGDGFSLESKLDLSAAWDPAPNQANPQLVPIDEPSRFFRLSK